MEYVNDSHHSRAGQLKRTRICNQQGYHFGSIPKNNCEIFEIPNIHSIILRVCTFISMYIKLD